MKNLLTILAIFLFLWVGGVIAQEDEGYESDGTLASDASIDAPVDGRALNGIFAYQEGDYACFWMVADSGLVLRYRGEDGPGYPNVKSLNRYVGTPPHDSLLDPAHNLMSISFAPYPNKDIGWIVGYVNGGTDKWRGVIYKTTNGGVDWSVQFPVVVEGISIPFLKVQAINENYVWVSCGHGYVLWTGNGGANWEVKTKPSGDTHFGWLRGVYAFSDMIAWVASDQSGLVAKTIDGGNSWTIWYPGELIQPQENLVYFDIYPGNSDAKVYLAASNGLMVYTTDGGETWRKEYVDRRIDRYQWWKALARQDGTKPDLFVGTGSVRKWKYLGYSSSKYDFNDIAYLEDGWDNEWCVAIGTPRILGSRLKRNYQYWYKWDDTPEFEITVVDAISSSNNVIIRLRIHNNTSRDTLRVQIFQSPCKEAGEMLTTSKYRALFTEGYLLTNLQQHGTCDKEINYTPSDSVTNWYGACLYHEERDAFPHPIYYSHNVDMAKAYDASFYQRPQDPSNLTVNDRPNDHGYHVNLDWNGPSPMYYLICKELDDTKIYVEPYWRDAEPYRGALWDETMFYHTRPHSTWNFTRVPNEFWMWSYDYHATSTCSTSNEGASIDNVGPPQVTGFSVSYNPTLDWIIFKWDEVTRAEEPNMGGYWVCVNFGPGTRPIHKTILTRNYFICKANCSWPVWGFSVYAEDRSGNKGPNSTTVDIPKPAIQATSPYATAFNQGRHLARFNETKELHLVYETEGNVIYCYSQDNGKNWYSEALGNGYFPCIAIDQNGLAWIAYWQDGDILCKIETSKNSWKEIIVYDGNGTTNWAGPPAIALGTIPDVSPEPPAFAYITYPTYEGDEMPEMPAPGPYPSTYSCIKLSILDTIDIAHYLIDEGDADFPVSDPAVAVTPADLLHLVWQKEDEIWYTTNIDKITYDNWQSVQIQEKTNISDSPGESSQHPFVEAYGENVYAAWKEGEPGEIFRRTKNLPYAVWGLPENISQSPDQESDYPVLATSDVVAYQEKIDDENYEIFAWIQSDIVNLSETGNPSKYPHIVVEPPTPLEPEIVIDAIWTEEITPNTLYEVKFKRYQHLPGPEGMGAYISVSVGDSVPSPYCEQRDGYIDYSEFSCDYSNASLIYNIPYLHPKSNYLLRAVVYKEGGSSWQEEFYVDTTYITEIIYEPSIPETIQVVLPKETYENDFAIGNEIERILGSNAVLADLKIFEVSLSDTSGGGGGQGNRTDIKQFALYQNCPNPFKDLTKISFALPKECKVSLFIYDVTGKRVRTLINDKLKPDNYQLRWDGKDDMKRDLAQGVYFYRLQTEDFKATKKMVQLKQLFTNKEAS